MSDILGIAKQFFQGLHQSKATIQTFFQDSLSVSCLVCFMQLLENSLAVSRRDYHMRFLENTSNLQREFSSPQGERRQLCSTSVVGSPTSTDILKDLLKRGGSSELQLRYCELQVKNCTLSTITSKGLLSQMKPLQVVAYLRCQY